MPQFVPEFPAQWTTLLNSYQIADQTTYVVGSTLDGTVNHYKFDDASGHTWIDSLNANNAMTSCSNATLSSVAGKINTAVRLGVNDCLEISSALVPNFAKSWSISFWINVAGLVTFPGSVGMDVWATNAANAIFPALNLEYSGSGSTVYNLRPAVTINNVTTYGGQSQNIQMGSWAHVVMMYDGDTSLSLYVNTLFVSSLVVSSLLNADFMSFGGPEFEGTFTFDDYQTFGRILTSDDISDLYYSGAVFNPATYSFIQFSISSTYSGPNVIPLQVMMLSDVDGNGTFQSVTEPSKLFYLPWLGGGQTNFVFSVSSHLPRKFQLAFNNATGGTVTTTVRMQKVPIVALNA